MLDGIQLAIARCAYVCPQIAVVILSSCLCKYHVKFSYPSFCLYYLFFPPDVTSHIFFCIFRTTMCQSGMVVYRDHGVSLYSLFWWYPNSQCVYINLSLFLFLKKAISLFSPIRALYIYISVQHYGFVMKGEKMCTS